MSEISTLLAAVVLIMSLGVTAQLLADRLEVPSVIFLLLAGILVGPEGLSVVTLELFGDTALRLIVGISVDIIVFEAAFHLEFERILEASREALGLVTVGALVSLVGTAVTVTVAFGATWRLGFLVGALLVATGPTVITPIMNVVPVRERVAAALETEGIVNDVTAAILAVAMFEFVIADAETPLVVVQAFGFRLGLGILVGVTVGSVLALFLRRVDLSAGNAPQNARLLVLVGAVGAYGLAETLLPEAGIAAAAVAGLTLGNADVPHEDDIAAFKGDVTLLVLSFVFVVLAALISFEDLLALGLPGLAVVAAIVLVIRPLGVALSTVGGRLSAAERVFVGAVGPRGIIPASVATLFAIELQNEAAQLRAEADAASEGSAELLAQAATLDQQAQLLAGTVFLVIFATVVIQGGLARHFAQGLDIVPMHTLVIGGGRVGLELAERFESRGEDVIIVDKDETAVETARDDGHRVVTGDATDVETLENARIENAAVVAAATPSDDVNLMVAQLARNRFGADSVVARVNRPENVDAFEDLDVRTISAGFAVADAMEDAIERPALSGWLADADVSGDVFEVELTAPDADDLTIRDLAGDLPDDCLVVMVSRNGSDQVPHGDFQLRHGDHLTLVTESSESMREAFDRCRAG